MRLKMDCIFASVTFNKLRCAVTRGVFVDD